MGTTVRRWCSGNQKFVLLNRLWGGAFCVYVNGDRFPSWERPVRVDCQRLEDDRQEENSFYRVPRAQADVFDGRQKYGVAHNPKDDPTPGAPVGEKQGECGTLGPCAQV